MDMNHSAINDMRLNKTTFFLLKPDCIKRRLTNRVVKKLSDAGFAINKLLKFQFHAEDIEELYRPFTLSMTPEPYKVIKKQLLTKYLTAGPTVYLHVRLLGFSKQCFDVFNYARSIQGTDYYPERCNPGSIRYDLRDKKRDGTWIIIEHIPNFGDLSGEIVGNISHTPASFDEYVYQNGILKNIEERRTII